MPDVDGDSIYSPADFLGWALKSGWSPSVLPIGVIYTFQSPVTRVIEQELDFVEERELTVSNASMFMTADDGPPVMVGCMNPGSASLATQLEHLRFLGEATRFAAIVGTAGALTPDFSFAQQVIASSAWRTDGISDRYLPPAPAVDASPGFVAALQGALGTDVPAVRTWTVPVPYRSTRADYDAAVAAGASVVEMEAATLFAVGKALGVETAATLVISDVVRAGAVDVDWSDFMPPTIKALLATVDVIREQAAS